MPIPIADTCEDCAALLKWVFSVKHGVRRPVHDYPKDGSMLLKSPNCKLCDLIKPRFPFDAETDMVTDIEIRAERDQNGNIAALHVELAYDTRPYRYSVHRIQLWAEKRHFRNAKGKKWANMIQATFHTHMERLAHDLPWDSTKIQTPRL